MSGERFLDDLARTLVQPMPRRRALRLLSGALAAVAVPALGPTAARASHSRGVTGCSNALCAAGETELGYNLTLQDGTVTCIHGCCVPRGVQKILCKSDPAYPLAWCCETSEACADPAKDGVLCKPKACPPERSGCGVCCAPGQYCDRTRRKCCPPDEGRSCGGPESDCKARVDAEVKFYEQTVCARSKKAQSIDGMQESAYFSLGCFVTAEAIMRHSEYGKCKQVSNDSLCPSGVRCDPASGLCMKPLCPSSRTASDRRPTSSEDLDVLSRSRALSASGPAALRMELRKHRSALVGDAGRVGRALAQRPTVARSRNLAKALQRYRVDVDALRASVEAIAENDPSARPAAQPMLMTLGFASSGLASFAAAVSAGRKAEAIRLGREAQRSFKRAAVSSGKTRKALGCGSSC